MATHPNDRHDRNTQAMSSSYFRCSKRLYRITSSTQEIGTLLHRIVLTRGRKKIHMDYNCQNLSWRWHFYLKPNMMSDHIYEAHYADSEFLDLVRQYLKPLWGHLLPEFARLTLKGNEGAKKLLQEIYRETIEQPKKT